MPVLKRNDTVGEGLNLQRWRVVRKIGEGQFAEVFEVSDTFKEGRKVALKVDRLLDVKTVEREAKVLKRLQPCPCVVRLLEQGTHEQRGFMVMELLGMNVADSRKSCTQDGKWDAPTARAIGLHLLNAISGMHQLGFIHRDVKPANFAITPRHAAVHEGAWHVIDFGLARRYVDDSGLVMPARAETAFRGSTTYASIAAHDEEDLGRRDDLWSWLYIMVEMITGTLPWRNEEGRDRDQVVRLKRECQEDPSKLSSSTPLPAPLARMSNHLTQLSFEADPDYALLRHCLDDLLNLAGAAQLNGLSAGVPQLTGLEDIADTPLSPPPEDMVDTPKSPPPEDAAVPPFRPDSAGPSAAGISNGMAPAQPAAAAARAPATGSVLGTKRPRPDAPRSPAEQPAERDARSGSREPDQRMRRWPDEGNDIAAQADRHERSQADRSVHSPIRSPSSGSASPAAGGRDADAGYRRVRSPDARHRGRSREQDRGTDHRGRSADRDRDRGWGGRSADRDRDWDRDRAAAADHYDRDRRDRTSERERAGETVRDADRGRYKDGSIARHNERPASARPGGSDTYKLDTSRCKHVHKYVARIKEGEMSEGAKDCKAQLKMISLTEGLGLAAYVIDSIVNEVSSRDADQMATLLGELEDYVWGQKQRARHRAKRG